MTKALVIGYGSIGSRHARLLDELGCEVGVVSHRALKTLGSLPIECRISTLRWFNTPSDDLQNWRADAASLEVDAMVLGMRNARAATSISP